MATTLPSKARLVLLRFVIISASYFLRVRVLAVGLLRKLPQREYGLPRRGCAPPQNDTFFDPSLSFL